MAATEAEPDQTLSETLHAAVSSRTEQLFQDMQVLLNTESKKRRLELQDEHLKMRKRLDDDRAKIEAESASLAKVRAELAAKQEEFDVEKAKMLGSRQMQDVLELNIGGQETCAVKRSTLCIVKDTTLESMFSGRWDEMLARGKDGRIFIDFAPDIFMPLLNFLRQKVIEDPCDPVQLPELSPEKTPAFHRMLKYYGILSAAPSSFKWEKAWGSTDIIEDGLVLRKHGISGGPWSSGAVMKFCAESPVRKFSITKDLADKPWYHDSFNFILSASSNEPSFPRPMIARPGVFAAQDRYSIDARLQEINGKCTMYVDGKQVELRQVGVGKPIYLCVALTYDWLRVRAHP